MGVRSKMANIHEKGLAAFLQGKKQRIEADILEHAKDLKKEKTGKNRNMRCPCGSGLKFKKCCWNRQLLKNARY